MKSSFLTWRAGKTKRQQMNLQLKKEMPAAFVKIREGWVPADADKKREPLIQLVEDTADLLQQLGSKVPESNTECAEMLEVLRGYPKLTKPVTQTELEDAALRVILETPERRMNPVLAALEAYDEFMYAAWIFPQGDSIAAMDAMARGASNLSRATFLTACKMASEGGNAKVLKNPAAAAKAAAKAEAKLLWEERRAGKHKSLRTVEQFAMEACKRWPVLGSIGTVKKWSEAWQKEADGRV